MLYVDVPCLKRAQGKYHEADDLYRRVVAIDEEAYGPDHPEVAADLTNWAVMLTWEVRIFANCVHSAPKRLVAIAQKRLLVTLFISYMIFKRMFKLEFRLIPRLIAQLQHETIAQNKHDRAIPLLERALAIQAKELGERHEHTEALALMLEDIRTEDEQVVS